MSSLRQLKFWFGETIGEVEGAAIWEAIENAYTRLADRHSLEPVLHAPPSLVLDDVAEEVDVGPFASWTNAFPLFQLGTISVPYDDATHGSFIGTTTPSTDTAKTVVLLARYGTADEVAILTTDSVPGFQELHHAVSYRVISGDEVATGAGPAKPASYDAEIAAGSVPLAVVYREDISGSLTDTLFPVLDVYQPTILERARGASILEPGCMVGDPEEIVWLPSLSSIDLGGSDWRVRLDNNPAWVARVGAHIFDASNKDASLISNALETPPINFVGTSLLRLKSSRYGFPDYPFIYVADGTNYPAADGDALDVPDTSLEGAADVDGGNPGVFSSTTKDLAIGIVTWNGASAPTLTPLANPPTFSFSTSVAADYASYTVLTNAALEVEITPPMLCGREWLVDVEFDDVNIGSAPANRGHPHNLQWRVKYQDFTKIVLLITGEWFDTTSGLATATTLRYFLPKCKVHCTLAPPIAAV